jgi:Tol biopolymer transport system component
VEGFDLFLYDLVNDSLEQLTSHPAMDRWPRFSRDGTQILFHSLRTGTQGLYIYDRATKTIRAVNTRTVNAAFGDW